MLISLPGPDSHSSPPMHPPPTSPNASQSSGALWLHRSCRDPSQCKALPQPRCAVTWNGQGLFSEMVDPQFPGGLRWRRRWVTAPRAWGAQTQAPSAWGYMQEERTVLYPGPSGHRNSPAWRGCIAPTNLCRGSERKQAATSSRLAGTCNNEHHGAKNKPGLSRSSAVLRTPGTSRGVIWDRRRSLHSPGSCSPVLRHPSTRSTMAQTLKVSCTISSLVRAMLGFSSIWFRARF